MQKKIVLVEWDDSNVIHGWMPDDSVSNGVAHCRTVGIVQYEDEKRLNLSMGDSNYGTILETITIPKGCITKIKELRTK